MLIQKKGNTGSSAQFMTRNQALKKLQLKLGEFRRLCILKGVHPREPRRKTQGAHKTYYHAKDIAFLLHEPLLAKMRELHAYEKKVRRAHAKKNAAAAARLAARRPRYALDHLVRERYPSFVDALRDLDDPLTMAHLFAVLPAEGGAGIPARVVRVARQLALEWQAWVVRAHALRRVFVSVKGFYLQAEVQGQAVTWLVPHSLSQVLPQDVDYRVMLTFLEFYQTLLQFVNFRLYHLLGLRYPPLLDPELEEGAAELEAVMRDLASAAGRRLEDTHAEAEPERREEAAADAAVQRRLTERVRQLEAEVAGGVGAGGLAAPASEDGGEAEGEVGSEGEEFDIDSGEEEEGAGDKVAGDGEEEEDASASDPESEDLEGGSESGEEEEESVDEGDSDGGADAGSADEALAGSYAPGLLVDPDDEAAVCATLFRGLVFFLGREVPRELLLLTIRSAGGEATWDGPGATMAEGDERITHQVVDRPRQGHRHLTRAYVQPQWVWDSLNARVHAPVERYAPGLAPPPHLSPFVDAEEEGYVPEYGRTLRALREATVAAQRRALGAGFVADLEEGAAAEAAEAAGGAAAPPSEEARAAAAAALHAAELAKELAPAEAADDRDPAARTAEEEAEAAMVSTMMTRKTRKLYASLQRSAAAKRARVEGLQQRAKQA
uniref:Pescadillo homolog n=2 Tax=Auxenochlorella protothecoides TaxID=3075 RepID=A0A1D2AC54_AUXPR